MADNEAMRLADAVDPLTRKGIDNLTCAAAAAELRRLHAEIAENESVINVWRGRTQRAEAEREALLEALDKIACFAPGYGEACEIIAKVARAAIDAAIGGGNG